MSNGFDLFANELHQKINSPEDSDARGIHRNLLSAIMLLGDRLDELRDRQDELFEMQKKTDRAVGLILKSVIILSVVTVFAVGRSLGLF